MSETDTTTERVLFTSLRLSMGWIFLFAFLDKLLGFGYEWIPGKFLGTSAENAWINGGSPTAGFLYWGTQNKWLESIFKPLAGEEIIINGTPVGAEGIFIVDLLFMVGLLVVGVTMFFGIARKIGAVSGAAMMLLMWLAILPLPNNPFIDSHIIYMLILLVFGFTRHTGVILIPQWKKVSDKISILE